MSKLSLRDDLRQATAIIHQELDALVGAFETLAEYGRYLSGAQQFRAAAEGLLGRARDGEWAIVDVAGEAERDLDDLRLSVRKPAVASFRRGESAWRIGACYVIEGSSVGARLLVRRAEALGLSDSYGARHLSRQAGDRERWPRFLEWLDRSGDIDREEARRGARDLFTLALSTHGRVEHERA